MKLLFIVMLMASALLSWDKQIILGSYSIENNGKVALSTLNKRIEKDKKLQNYIQKFNLKTTNTVIGDYTVVSIYSFDSFVSLLRTLKHLKTYYSDAYVLHFPSKSSTQEILVHSQENISVQPQQSSVVDSEEADLVENEASPSVDLEQESNEETMNSEKSAEVETPVQEATKDSQKTVVQAEKVDNENESDNLLYYILGLVVLGLIAVGAIMMNGSSKKKENEEDE